MEKGWRASFVGCGFVLLHIMGCAGGRFELRALYYPSGAKEAEGLYRDADMARVGKWREWYENGNVKSEGEWLTDPLYVGARQGMWKYWHENGMKAAEGEYDGDLFDGVWVFWNKMGLEIARCEFENGSGWYVETDGKGRKRVEGQMQNNRRNGKWTLWYPNGQKYAEGMCKSGARDGTWTFWSESGRISHQETVDWMTSGDFGDCASRIAD